MNGRCDIPKWLTLPPDRLLYNPEQEAFLQARRNRICRKCRIEFSIPPDLACPQCGGKGVRAYDRLTIIAGRRWGKSLVGSIAGVEEACIPHTIGWACAPSDPKLHRYVIPAFQKLIPDSWVQSWSAEYCDLRLKNGSLIHFQTLEDPDQGRGQGLDWLWIDEVCELTEDHWNVIRPSLGDKQGVAFFTTSPRSFDWVYEDLYKPAEDEEVGYWGLHAKTADNPIFHTPEGREFLSRERAKMPDTMFRQEYEADFVTFTGAVYGNLLDSQILRTPEQMQALIPEWPQVASHRQVLVGIDTGADHPFGAVRIISTEAGLVVTGQYLERHKSFIEHAAELKRLAGPYQTRWGINKNDRQSMIELGQHGIFPAPAENDIIAGTERVKTWLHQKRLWFYEPGCPQVIKQMKAYRWAENTSPKDGQARKEKVYKKNDELPDAIRYALMTWPQLPEAQAKSTQRDLTGFAPELKVSIERLRRIEGREKEPKIEVVGDFWG